MTETEYELLRERIVAQFPLGRYSVHGPFHWERVDAWGQRLAASTSGADLLVVRLFAIFHDSQRFSECTDPLHGARGAAFAQRVHQEWFEIGGSQLRLLIQACERHELGETSNDRLLLGRRPTRPATCVDRTGPGFHEHVNRATVDVPISANMNNREIAC